MEKIKRLMALLLCLCITVTIFSPEMLSKAEEGTTLYTLNGQDGVLCYEDDFSTNTKYLSALGNYQEVQNYLKWNEGSQNLPKTGTAMFNGLGQITQNYTISAQVTAGDTASGYVALIAYGTDTNKSGSTTGYEFGLVKGNQFRLSYRVSGTHKTFSGLNTINVKDAGLGITDNAVGKAITMSFSATTNEEGNVELVCYASYGDKKVKLFEHIAKTDETKIESGVPGVHVSNGSVDNVSVIRKQEAIETTGLYEDDFSTVDKYTTAMGSYAEGNQFVMPWNEADKNLLCETAGYAVFKGLTNASSMQNYTISVDVTPGATTDNITLIAYGDGEENSTTGYEFGMIYNKNTSKPYFRLAYRDASGKVHTLNNYTNLYLSNITKLGITDSAVGKTITMSFSASTNASGNVTLTCYASHNGTKVTVFETYTTNENDTYSTCGAPGFRTGNAGATLDNISVTRATSSTVLYADAFADSIGYSEALGANLTTAGLRWNENQTITITGESGSSTRYESVFAGITNASGLKNYTIVADVTYNSTNTKNFGGVVAYAGKDTGYEFAIFNKGFRLQRRSASNSTLYPATSDEAFDYTQSIRLSLTALTNYDESNNAVSVTLIGKATQGEIEKTIFEVEDKNNFIVSGAPGLRVAPASKTCTVDDICISKVPENYMGIKVYRSDEAYTAPTKEGYVFAGWYTDKELATPLAEDVKFGGAYAKWVDKEVLKAICQLPANVAKSDGTTNLRIMTSVDSGQYQKVGFTVSVENVRNFDFTDTKEVYKKITAIEDKIGAYEYDAMTAFENNDSKYFMAHTLLGIPGTVFDTTITVTPKWTTLDGTTVTGQIKTFTINNVIDKLSNSNQ